MTVMSRLPSRFPVGTRFVVEGRPGKGGKLKIVSRYVVLPNGTQYDLMGPEKPRRTARDAPDPDAASAEAPEAGGRAGAALTPSSPWRATPYARALRVSRSRS